MLKVKVPGGGPAEARRLSFRALDIEQIGHVYEGLLDHTALRAAEPILGLAGTRDKEPEIPLAKLEEFVSRQDAKTQREPGNESFAALAALREDFLRLAEGTDRPFRVGAAQSAARQDLQPFNLRPATPSAPPATTTTPSSATSSPSPA